MEMKLITVKPITDQKLDIAKKFEELVYKDLPLHKWCREQEKRNKKIKL